MITTIAIIVVCILVVYMAYVLIRNGSAVDPIIIAPVPCPHEASSKRQQGIFSEMMKRSNPPGSQPVYTLFRNVPKTAVTNVEMRYLKSAVEWFSKGELMLLDVENVNWMAKDSSSPIVALLDGRVKVKEAHEVVRVIMMWSGRDLWVIHAANAKGCLTGDDVKDCKVEIGEISNDAIQMPAYHLKKSIMGREQKFEWDSTGVLKTEEGDDMINSAWTERSGEIYQNPTLPRQTEADKQRQRMFFKTNGIPSK